AESPFIAYTNDMTDQIFSIAIPLIVLAVLVLGFVGAPFWAWTVLAAAALWVFQAPEWLWIVAGVVAVVGNIKPIRRMLLSTPLMRAMVKFKVLPKISETERVALRAGDVWVEKDLF